MYQSLFHSWFPLTTSETHDDSTVPIFIDSTFTTNVRIEVKQNMLVSDMLQFVHGDDQKQKFDLILVNENVQRRLWDYEKLEDVRTKCSKFLIWDFSKKQMQHLQKIPQYFDDTFKAYGHLLKKNKLGKYVETRVYLSQSYFGFRNETKSQIKLSAIENIKLYTWPNNTKFDFQIESERKLYFFQAKKQIDFNYWIQSIQQSLEQAVYKTQYKDYDQRIIAYSQKLINKVEEFAQNTLQHSIIQSDYLESLQQQIVDICDVNIIEFLLTQDEDLIPHIRKQIQTETFTQLKPFQRRMQVQKLRIITPRYHALFENDELENVIDKLSTEINECYVDFIKIQQIKPEIIQYQSKLYKEQFQCFQPSFDQFY